MILHVKYDATYLVMPVSCSRISVQYYLSDHPTNSTNPSYFNPNRPIITYCKTLRNLVVSATEAETGRLFINGHHIVPILTAYIELYCLQPKTPLNTYNYTSKGYYNRPIRKKRYKSLDLCFHWLRNRDAQEQLKNFWDKGINKN